MKFLLDRHIEQLKARLIVKSYTQTYGVSYFEALSNGQSSFSVNSFVHDSG